MKPLQPRSGGDSFAAFEMMFERPPAAFGVSPPREGETRAKGSLHTILNCSSLPPLTRCRANPCIDHSATLTGRKREYWIEIQFADFRNVFDHTGDTEQDFLDSFDVGWSVTSITFEQAITAD